MANGSEQWFLDLDGVRSGPYQTPEVLSLIAEGEILPHHKISTQLKDGSWKTILDWRLEQSKRPSPPPSAPEVEETASLKTEEPVFEDPPESFDPSEAFEEVDLHQSHNTIPTEEEIEPLPPFEPEAPMLTPAPKKTSGTSGRDPMAEMFDMLQNTKQKREAKSAQYAATEQARTEASPSSAQPSSSFVKPILLGTLIIAIGFILGQAFHQSSFEEPSSSTTSTVVKTAPAPTSTTAEAKPSATPIVETLEKRTDKYTVRSVVQRPAPDRRGSERQALPNRDTDKTQKELEDVKELKKELAELKALKEALRSAPQAPQDNRDLRNGDYYEDGVDPGYQYYPPPGGNQPPNPDEYQAYPPGYPNNYDGYPEEPTDTHY